MKIVFATGIFPPDIGGPATYTERLTQELCQRNFKMAVITYSDIKNSKVQPEIQNYDFPVVRVSRKYPKGLRHFLYFWHLFWLAKDCDVVYAQNLISAGFPALLVSKILRKKLVVKIVGDAAWEHGREKGGISDSLDFFQQKKYGWQIEFLRKIQRWVAKNVHKIITPSQYLKKIIVGLGVPPAKIEVIYNAPESILRSGISKEAAKKNIGFGGEGDIILSVARLVPWKGILALIEIIPHLLSENPNFRLVVVGDGEEKKNLELRIRNLGLDEKVILAGRIGHERIPLYYKAADIFILNSEYEGLSHVILEAMQFGVPVVASNQGGNPELIQDNFNGFLTEYNNRDQLKEAILRIWRDKNLQEKFIQNSKEKLKEFTWDNLVEKTIKILGDRPDDAI